MKKLVHGDKKGGTDGNAESPNYLSVLSIYYNGIIGLGVVLAIASFFTNNIVLNLLSYSLITLGVLIVIGIIANNFNTIMKKNNQTMMKTLYVGVLNMGPFLAIISVLCYLIYLTVTYKDIISSGHISEGYHVYNNVTVLLIFVQMALLQWKGMDENFKKTGKLSSFSVGLSYLISTISLVYLAILTIIVKDYTTQG